MPVDPKLLEIVACPKCKGEVDYHEGGGQGEGFACQSCSLFYPVEDDIPNFLIDEAHPLADAD